MEKSKTSVQFPENRELRKQLRKGDMVDIARLSKVSVAYVRNVMGGYRRNDMVIACAKRVINDRQHRLEQIANPIDKSTIINES